MTLCCRPELGLCRLNSPTGVPYRIAVVALLGLYGVPTVVAWGTCITAYMYVCSTLLADPCRVLGVEISQRSWRMLTIRYPDCIWYADFDMWCLLSTKRDSARRTRSVVRIRSCKMRSRFRFFFSSIYRALAKRRSKTPQVSGTVEADGLKPNLYIGTLYLS